LFMHNTLSILSGGHVVCQFDSVYLKRTVELDVFCPPQLLERESINLLVLNDGQDAGALNLEETLEALHGSQKIEPVLVVAVHASDARLQEYGVAGNPDFKGRGALAGAYSNFIINELLPFLEAEAGRPIAGTRAIAGCSMGGLTAFDIAWNHGGVFDVAGVFSGAFWWRKKDLNDGYTDDDRIMHQVIRNSKSAAKVKFWLMAGTEDEKADRNNNYIIDTIDDTIDIIKELMRKGYNRPHDIFYYEMVGGQHNTASWAKAFPAFLSWTFGRKMVP
jgi:enterochelin esterase-like enzyme